MILSTNTDSKFYVSRNRFIDNARITLIVFGNLQTWAVSQNNLCTKAVSIDEVTLINNTFDAQTPITIPLLSISVQHVHAEQNYVKAAIIVLGFDKENSFSKNVAIQVSSMTFMGSR